MLTAFPSPAPLPAHVQDKDGSTIVHALAQAVCNSPPGRVDLPMTTELSLLWEAGVNFG